jgi:hypothetical protein
MYSELSNKRIGVAACIWDSAFVLSAFLCAPTCSCHRSDATGIARPLEGLKIVELGAGCGLLGLVAASLGARVTLTDRPCVMPLMEQNARHNGFEPDQVTVMPLQWGTDTDMDQVAAVGPCDLVVATDVCYVDNIGVSPHIESFVKVARALITTNGSTGLAYDPRVVLAWEVRTPEVRDEMVGYLLRDFSRVRVEPLPAVPSAWRPDNIEIFECRL